MRVSGYLYLMNPRVRGKYLSKIVLSVLHVAHYFLEYEQREVERLEHRNQPGSSCRPSRKGQVGLLQVGPLEDIGTFLGT